MRKSLQLNYLGEKIEFEAKNFCPNCILHNKLKKSGQKEEFTFESLYLPNYFITWLDHSFENLAWIQLFFSLFGFLTMAKEPRLLYYLLLTGKENRV